MANVFHAGDGNLHPLVLFDDRVAGEEERAEELSTQILDICIAHGGSITGEHGVGLHKLSAMTKCSRATTSRPCCGCEAPSTPTAYATRGKRSPRPGCAASHPGPVKEPIPYKSKAWRSCFDAGVVLIRELF